MKKLLKDILTSTETDKYAKATKEYLIKYFGIAISTIINILDPDIIVLGGGVSNVDFLYSEGVKEIEKSIFNTRVDTKIVKNMLGDSAGVFGAAMLVAQY